VLDILETGAATFQHEPCTTSDEEMEADALWRAHEVGHALGPHNMGASAYEIESYRDGAFTQKRNCSQYNGL
jgi:hypothetical protein